MSRDTDTHYGTNEDHSSCTTAAERDERSASRRGILKRTGTAIGGASVAGLASTGTVAAQDSQSAVKIKEVTKVAETDSRRSYVVTVSQSSSPTGEATVTKLLITLGKGERAKVTAQEIDAPTDRQLKTGAISPSSVTTAGNEDLVERKKQVSVDTLPCNVYNNHTHEFHGVAIEYKQKVNDIGISTAAGIAATFIAAVSSFLAALIIGVGGLFALISDTDSVTIGVVELDRWLYLDPAYQEAIALGYNAAERGAFNGYYAKHPKTKAGHPFR